MSANRSTVANRSTAASAALGYLQLVRTAVDTRLDAWTTEFTRAVDRTSAGLAARLTHVGDSASLVFNSKCTVLPDAGEKGSTPASIPNAHLEVIDALRAADPAAYRALVGWAERLRGAKDAAARRAIIEAAAQQLVAA